MSTPDRTLIVRPQAAFELDAAFAYYEQQRAGLGTDFLLAVDEAFAALLAHPEIGREITPRIRRSLLRRFPYGLFYALRPTQVVVLAVLDLRRSPRRWPRRADG